MSLIMQTIEAQGRRLVWVAERLGISRSQLTNALAGRRRLTDDQAVKLAEILGLPPAVVRRELSDGDEPPPDPS